MLDSNSVELVIPPDVLAAAMRAAQAAYPRECCGALIGSAARAEEVDAFIEFANDQDRLHAADPVAHPRDARSGFTVAARDLFRAVTDPALGVKAIVHSHPDGVAILSATDLADAFAGGEAPAYPVQQLVIAVDRGRAVDARLFAFDLAARRFVERELVASLAGARPDATGKDLINAARSRVPEIGATDLAALIGESPAGAKQSRPVILDVRETEELAAGRIPGALHVPRGFLELKIESTLTDRARPVVCYCAGGVRSLLAAQTLKTLGYADVRSLAGGFKGWKDAGLQIETTSGLSATARERYSRHLLIPEVGEAGQLALLASQVLIIGAGGLGSPAAFYLAAAGVGHLRIVDFDVVDRSNLQRQILHTDARVGTPKIDSARATLAALNPEIRIETFSERLDSTNVERLMAGCNVIVDGSDNFATRYLVNDACVKLKIPCVHGSIYRFDGQVTVFWPGRGPCYRCLFPAPPPPELAPSCAEAGVLGVLPGVIGVLEAVEAIKIIIDRGRTLNGRLLTYDALEATFKEFKLRADPDCRVCAPGRPFPGYIDYESFCRDRTP